MSFNSVIPLCDLARAGWRSESAKLDVTLTAQDQVVGICVSMCKMFEGYKLTLDKKYLRTVPSAQSPVWMMGPLLHWLEKQTPWKP